MSRRRNIASELPPEFVRRHASMPIGVIVYTDGSENAQAAIAILKGAGVEIVDLVPLNNKSGPAMHDGERRYQGLEEIIRFAGALDPQSSSITH